MTDHPIKVSEQQAREIAENARETKWSKPSFLREVFLGNFRYDLISPFPPDNSTPAFHEFYSKLKTYLDTEVDSAAIDQTGEYPAPVLQKLKEMGAFAMKIPKEYGGLGFSQQEYSKIMEMIGARDANIAVLLSAHLSIGVPQPVKLFGSSELKNKYLPRCAAGAISAFALTEPEVGSDPARLATTVKKVVDESGDYYILNGTKLWCTNGNFAELLVVMAKSEDTNKISAFVVETTWPGIKVVHRCSFMGLRAIQNGVLKFENVRIPAENIIGKEGQGLKIALTTLNAGRLALPAASVGIGRACLNYSIDWSNKREQWGRSIGKHEAVAQKLAKMSADLYAMQAISELASRMEDEKNRDIRMEAAAAKEWNSVQAWNIVDETLQIRGGRGYENETSLAERGELPIPIERMMRDTRINRIIEGSSEILHLFLAREAVDKHLNVAGNLIDPKASFGKKLKSLFKAGIFYPVWYSTRWLNWRAFRYNPFSMKAWMERKSRKLARSIFHGMVVYGGKLQHKQAFLFRTVDIGMNLLVMAATLAKTEAIAQSSPSKAPEAMQLCKLVYKELKKRINSSFKALWSNNDREMYGTAKQLLDGGFQWHTEEV